MAVHTSVVSLFQGSIDHYVFLLFMMLVQHAGESRKYSGGGGGVQPNMGYLAICCCEGYGFQAL